MKSIEISKAAFKQQYEKSDLTLDEIANFMSCSKSYVCKLAKKFGFKMRGQGNYKRNPNSKVGRPKKIIII